MLFGSVNFNKFDTLTILYTLSIKTHSGCCQTNKAEIVWSEKCLIVIGDVRCVRWFGVRNLVWLCCHAIDISSLTRSFSVTLLKRSDRPDIIRKICNPDDQSIPFVYFSERGQMQGKWRLQSFNKSNTNISGDVNEHLMWYLFYSTRISVFIFLLWITFDLILWLQVLQQATRKFRHIQKTYTNSIILIYLSIHLHIMFTGFIYFVSYF